MHITFLTQWFDPEPGAIRGLPLAAWLTERGHQVEVVTGFPNYPGGKVYPGYQMGLRQREEVRGVGVTRIPLYPSHDHSTLRRIANYTSFALSASTIGSVVSGSTDVIFAYHPPATIGLPALIWKKIRSAPIVYHIADMWPESVTQSGMIRSYGLRSALDLALGWWCQQVYGQAAAITVISPGFKRLLIDRGVPPGKIEVIYNWADEEIFHPAPRDQALARALGFTNHFNIVYAGNLGPFQSLGTAIRAAASLQHLAGLQLVLVGTGQSEGALRKLAQDLDAGNIRFLGRREYLEMGAVSNLADVLLVALQDLPFLATTVPSKTQVALASGRPIIMAARGDANDLVRQASAGLTCTPGDERSMAAAMEQLYGCGEESLASMGRKGYRFYLDELSLRAGGERMEALMEGVLADHRQRGPQPRVRVL